MGRSQHNPDDVFTQRDISGYCNHCHRKQNAWMTVYWSGEILIRCKNCRRTNSFVPDEGTYNEPGLYPPKMEDDRDNEDHGGWEDTDKRGGRRPRI